MTAEDVKNIRKIAKEKQAFSLLSTGVAPSIQGHSLIKKAVLLQLLGGKEKNLQNTTHLRGDINLLLVGDPSTAKSQLLRQAMGLTHLAIATTGRGSSGVGLTAAVTIDQDTGERHLDAGAMVLADQGLICIDEFDKMDDRDRVAIHEVMEQQTVTISKAGIHCRLNARCSVLAAANPTFGDYDRSRSAAENIGLPDSLLSRFDLLFVVLDEKNPVQDAKVADRVILNHTYRSEEELKSGDDKTNVLKKGMDDFILEQGLETDDTKTSTPFNKIMVGTTETQIVNKFFLKKFISYCKKNINPTLSQGAIDFLSLAYAELRKKGEDPQMKCIRKLPITVRTLETLIRLGTAHAKLRLSDTVTIEDIQVVFKILNFCIFSEDDETEEVKNYLIQENVKSDAKVKVPVQL